MDSIDFIYTFGIPNTCTYCGQSADTLDHCIPYSFSRGRQTKGSKSPLGFCTYCCRECNSLLGSSIFPTFQERLVYLNKKLSKKYNKFLTVVWDEEDLSSVSGNLKRYITGFNNLNKITRERLDWIYSPTFLKMLSETQEDVASLDIPQHFKDYIVPQDT